ncbi:MAG TPA: hypothetical protein VF510_11590 [Ktedonobacterales bacterium]
MASTSASVRHPALSTLEKTTVGVYVLILLALLYEQFGLFGGLFPPIGLIQMIVVVPALIGFAIRQRWLLVVTIVLLVLDLLYSVPYIVGDLGRPENTGPFVWTLIALPLYVAGIVLAAILFMRKLPARA